MEKSVETENVYLAVKLTVEDRGNVRFDAAVFKTAESAVEYAEQLKSERFTEIFIKKATVNE